MQPLCQLLLGTNNQGKFLEMSALLKQLPVELLGLADVQLNYQIEETGASYLENATLKALGWSRRSGLATLADDSGLEVAVINGSPGLRSHRFTGDANASDAERRGYLLGQLKYYPRPWKACFRCAIAVAIPGYELITGSGVCNGEIIPEERGTYGFGYDPIFLVTGAGKTMAELSLAEKNQLSHRAKGIKSVLPSLITIFTRE